MQLVPKVKLRVRFLETKQGNSLLSCPFNPCIVISYSLSIVSLYEWTCRWWYPFWFSSHSIVLISHHSISCCLSFYLFFSFLLATTSILLSLYISIFVSISISLSLPHIHTLKHALLSLFKHRLLSHSLYWLHSLPRCIFHEGAKQTPSLSPQKHKTSQIKCPTLFSLEKIIGPWCIWYVHSKLDMAANTSAGLESVTCFKEDKNNHLFSLPLHSLLELERALINFWASSFIFAREPGLCRVS